jgi:hypothetical protein
MYQPAKESRPVQASHDVDEAADEHKACPCVGMRRFVAGPGGSIFRFPSSSVGNVNDPKVS